MRHSRILIATSVASMLLGGVMDVSARSGGGFSGGGGKGFSGGGGGFSSGSRSSSPSFGSGGSRSSSPSFGSGSSGSRSGSSPSFGSGSGSGPSKTYTTPSSKGFSAPTPSFAPSPSHKPSTSSTTAAPSPAMRAPAGYDADAQRARAEERSRSLFERLEPSKPVAQPARPASVPSYGSDRRPTAQPTQRSAPNSRPIVVQREPVFTERSGGGSDISPWFWIWLMNNNNRDRDEWIYHNRERIPESRMEELRRKDERLDERIRGIENAGLKKDPTYKVPEEALPPPPVQQAQPRSESHWFRNIILVFGGLSLAFAFVYLVFFKRFDRRRFA